jgi:hypothetical protein
MTLGGRQQTNKQTNKQTKKPNDQNTSYAGFQMFKHMLRVDTRGDKVRAFL